MKENPNLIIEIVKILITASLAAFLTYWFAFKKDREEKRYQAYKELLEKVYGPIIKKINNAIFPGDGYEGIYESNLTEIIDIIEDNLYIVDLRLETYAWWFKEEIIHNNRSNNNNQYELVYDEDRKFIDYVLYRYHYIRKKTYLPYDPRYFKLRKIYKKIQKLYYKTERRFYKRLRKVRRMK